MVVMGPPGFKLKPGVPPGASSLQHANEDSHGRPIDGRRQPIGDVIRPGGSADFG